MTARTVLFFRDFRGFAGGHLKVWHYFNHVRHSAEYRPEIHFSTDSLWDHTNPWIGHRAAVKPTRRPERADVLFLAGTDWLQLPEPERERGDHPVINLIQGFRHTRKGDVCYGFLRHRAIRICVSEEVAGAVRATGRACGPVLTIPNGIDVAELPDTLPWCDRGHDLLIGAAKRPDLVSPLGRRWDYADLRLDLLATWVPRDEFIARLNNARVALLLPLTTEGFFLPALEAMALGTILVCPDCVGNRSFCLPERNCLRPAYTVDEIIGAVERALGLAEVDQAAIQRRASETLAKHDLSTERRAFMQILDNLDTLW